MTIETGLLAAFAAYALIWILLGGYLFFIDRRVRRLERELGTLRRAPDLLPDHESGAVARLAQPGDARQAGPSGST